MSNLQPNCCLEFDFQKVMIGVMASRLFDQGHRWIVWSRSPVDSPHKRAINVENVFIWLRHNDDQFKGLLQPIIVQTEFNGQTVRQFV